MIDFFEEYGWLIQSMIGGSIGIEILLTNVLNNNGKFVQLLKVIMEGLM